MKWALVSVWDKTGIVELVQALIRHRYNIMSSGGTGKVLADSGVKFTEVSSYTGFPEMMDGRVKTLHPKVHGGLLGRRQVDDAVMARHGINRIDLLVVNLYPFEQMSAQKMDLDALIEYIDVGGPAMIRAAAKNYKDVAVVVDPTDYSRVITALEGGGFSPEDRLLLAKKAFARTAAYDGAISNTCTSLTPHSLTQSLSSSPTAGHCGTGKTLTSRLPYTGLVASPVPPRYRVSRCPTTIILMSMQVQRFSVNLKNQRQRL